MNTKLRVVEPGEPLTAREEAHQAVSRYKQRHQYRTPWVEPSHPSSDNPLPVDDILRRSEPNLVGKK